MSSSSERALGATGTMRAPTFALVVFAGAAVITLKLDRSILAATRTAFERGGALAAAAPRAARRARAAKAARAPRRQARRKARPLWRERRAFGRLGRVLRLRRARARRPERRRRRPCVITLGNLRASNAAIRSFLRGAVGRDRRQRARQRSHWVASLQRGEFDGARRRHRRVGEADVGAQEFGRRGAAAAGRPIARGRGLARPPHWRRRRRAGQAKRRAAAFARRRDRYAARSGAFM